MRFLLKYAVRGTREEGNYVGRILSANVVIVSSCSNDPIPRLSSTVSRFPSFTTFDSEDHV